MEREALLHLARMLGDETVLAPLGLTRQHLPPALDEGQRWRLQQLLDGELGRLARALLAEAAASDDVTDRSSALAYLEDRLRSLSRLLSDGQRSQLWESLLILTEGWEKG